VNEVASELSILLVLFVLFFCSVRLGFGLIRFGLGRVLWNDARRCEAMRGDAMRCDEQSDGK
jgi:hypothetical protein